MMPYKNYKILTEWEKSNAVVVNHYYDNDTLFMYSINILVKFTETMYYLIQMNPIAYDSESNVFSHEVIKYKIDNKEFTGKSINSYLFNFDINEKVDVYYNPSNKSEVIINSIFRLYIEPIINLILTYLIFWFFYYFYKEYNKTKFKPNTKGNKK